MPTWFRLPAPFLLSVALSWTTQGGTHLELQYRHVCNWLLGEAAIDAPFLHGRMFDAQMLLGGSLASTAAAAVKTPDPLPLTLHAGTQMTLAFSPNLQVSAEGRAAPSNVSGEAGLRILF